MRESLSRPPLTLHCPNARNVGIWPRTGSPKRTGGSTPSPAEQDTLSSELHLCCALITCDTRVSLCGTSVVSTT